MVSLDRTLLRLHVEAVWGVRLPHLVADEHDLLPESARPGWKLCAAELSEGRLHLWRSDVSPMEREALRLRVHEALPFPEHISPLPGISREVALSLAVSPRLDRDAASRITRPLTSQDRSLVEAFYGSVSDEYPSPEKRPIIGVVVAGQLLSLAHSSRRTGEACELGIDTLPEARRKGYALAATIVWTHAVRQEGLVPIYSAFAENIPSLQLAAAAGYRPFARIAMFEA